MGVVVGGRRGESRGPVSRPKQFGTGGGFWIGVSVGGGFWIGVGVGVSGGVGGVRDGVG